MPTVPQIVLDVQLEIHEMRKLGAYTTKQCLKMQMYAQDNAADIVEYDNSGMSCTEIVDLVRDLAFL